MDRAPLAESTDPPRKPGEEPPMQKQPPFFLQLGKPREVPGLPAFKTIKLQQGVPLGRMIFQEPWLLRQTEEKMAMPAVLADSAELLARSSSTGFNMCLSINAVTDDLYGRKQTVNGAVAVSKHPWLRIEVGTFSPSHSEFAYVPYFEKLREATVSSEFMLAFGRLSNHLRSGDKPGLPRHLFATMLRVAGKEVVLDRLVFRAAALQFSIESILLDGRGSVQLLISGAPMVHVQPVEGLAVLETMLGEEASGAVVVPAMIGSGSEESADESRTRLVAFLCCDAPSIVPEGSTRRGATELPYLAAWPKLADALFLKMVSVIQKRDDLINIDLATITTSIHEYLSELGCLAKFESYYQAIASTAFKWNNAAQVSTMELPPMSTGGLSTACLFTKVQSVSTHLLTREECLRKRSEFALVATAVEFALNAFMKINISLLERKAVEDRMEALDRALRTHVRSGASAFSAMLQTLLDLLFPGTKLPQSYSKIRPESFILRIAEARKANFNAWHVVFLGGKLMQQDVLAGYEDRLMDFRAISALFEKERKKLYFSERASADLVGAIKSLSLALEMDYITNSAVRFGIKIEKDSMDDSEHKVLEFPYPWEAYSTKLVTLEYKGVRITPWLAFDASAADGIKETSIFSPNSRLLKLAFSMVPVEGMATVREFGMLYDPDDPESGFPGYTTATGRDGGTWFAPDGGVGYSAPSSLTHSTGPGPSQLPAGYFEQSSDLGKTFRFGGLLSIGSDTMVSSDEQAKAYKRKFLDRKLQTAAEEEDTENWQDMSTTAREKDRSLLTVYTRVKEMLRSIRDKAKSEKGYLDMFRTWYNAIVNSPPLKLANEESSWRATLFPSWMEKQPGSCLYSILKEMKASARKELVGFLIKWLVRALKDGPETLDVRARAVTF